jgi:hypothetical protein
VTPRRDRWADFDRPYAPPVAVEGGVRVAKPGAVRSQAAARLVVLAEGRTTPGIGSRGRTYARKGQVVEVRVVAGTASAAIQGSDAEPYSVALTHEDGTVEAQCSCPYGCDAVEWCKHAAALAYVVAHLVDTDPGLGAAWSGAAPASGGPGASGDASPADAGEPAPGVAGASSAARRSLPALPPQEVARRVTALRADRPAVGAAARWAAAAEVLPLPWRPRRGDSA